MLKQSKNVVKPQKKNRHNVVKPILKKLKKKGIKKQLNSKNVVKKIDKLCHRSYVQKTGLTAFYQYQFSLGGVKHYAQVLLPIKVCHILVVWIKKDPKVH